MEYSRYPLAAYPPPLRMSPKARAKSRQARPRAAKTPLATFQPSRCRHHYHQRQVGMNAYGPPTEQRTSENKSAMLVGRGLLEQDDQVQGGDEQPVVS
jgi:hypothetical protein